jgi:CspA family cold shock protein
VGTRVSVSLDGSFSPATRHPGRVRRAAAVARRSAARTRSTIEERVSRVPTGRVKWYDAEKGFGFLAQDGGEDVYVRKAALPAGVAGLKPGQRVEFGMAEGRRGPQALSVRLVDAPPSVVEATRRPAEELHGLIEDMIRLLETKVQPDLRRGRYPDRRTCKLAAEVVRAVARDLDG